MPTINELMESNPSGVKLRYRNPNWNDHQWFRVYFYESSTGKWHGLDERGEYWSSSGHALAEWEVWTPPVRTRTVWQWAQQDTGDNWFLSRRLMTEEQAKACFGSSCKYKKVSGAIEVPE
jgi:hypothetical protein